MTKHKVKNDNTFPVGLKFDDRKEATIRPKSFMNLEEDQINYINSISKLFSEGTIYCETAEIMANMGYVEKNANIITEDEIKNIFKGNVQKMKESLSKITAKHAIDKVIEVAKQSDLPASKITAIEEVYGRKLYDDMTSEII